MSLLIILFIFSLDWSVVNQQEKLDNFYYLYEFIFTLYIMTSSHSEVVHKQPKAKQWYWSDYCIMNLKLKTVMKSQEL